MPHSLFIASQPRTDFCCFLEFVDAFFHCSTRSCAMNGRNQSGKRCCRRRERIKSPEDVCLSLVGNSLPILVFCFVSKILLLFLCTYLNEVNIRTSDWGLQFRGGVWNTVKQINAVFVDVFVSNFVVHNKSVSCMLFNDAVSSSDYISSNDRMSD